MESTRSIGYSFESAIADIIDNSISASALSIWIQSIPSKNPYVSILDDGEGLSKDDLIKAMRYGTNPNMIRSKDDLGRFGLGMKMASLSQCRRLSVISKINNSICACRWDLDRVLETDDWTLQVLSTPEIIDLPQFKELEKLSHGTLVVWDNLDKIAERATDIQVFMTTTLNSCKKHLSLVFHRFLDRANPLNIYLNNSKIVPLDPFFSSSPLTAALPEQTIFINGEKVVVKPYVLPPESKMKPSDIEKIGGLQKNLQGFWVYRNKRLIIPGTWFKLSRSKELTKLARVRVDIPNSLDGIWEIDVKKSSATIPAVFQEDFEKILDKVLEKSEKKYKFRGRKESDKNKSFIWDKYSYQNGFSYRINRDHPLFKYYIEGLDDQSKSSILDLIKLIEESIPYQDMYLMMGEAKLSLNRKEMTSEDKDDIINKGIRLIEEGFTVDDLRLIEPFSGNFDILDILENYSKNK